MKVLTLIVAFILTLSPWSSAFAEKCSRNLVLEGTSEGGVDADASNIVQVQREAAVVGDRLSAEWSGDCSTVDESIECTILATMEDSENSFTVNAKVQCDVDPGSPFDFRAGRNCGCTVTALFDEKEKEYTDCNCVVCPTGSGDSPMKVSCGDPFVGECRSVNCDLVCDASISPPEITITYPKEGQAFVVCDMIHLLALVEDSEGDATTVLWFLNDDQIASGASAAIKASDLGIGKQRILAVATDSNGLIDDDAVNIKINSNKPPQIDITSPKDGDRVSYTDRINLEAYAEDPEDGPLTGCSITWSIDGKPTDCGQSPPKIRAEDIGVGSHIIRATATDSCLANATTTVEILVAAPQCDNEITRNTIDFVIDLDTPPQGKKEISLFQEFFRDAYNEVAQASCYLREIFQVEIFLESTNSGAGSGDERRLQSKVKGRIDSGCRCPTCPDLDCVVKRKNRRHLEAENPTTTIRSIPKPPEFMDRKLSFVDECRCETGIEKPGELPDYDVFIDTFNKRLEGGGLKPITGIDNPPPPSPSGPGKNECWWIGGRWVGGGCWRNQDMNMKGKWQPMKGFGNKKMSVFNKNGKD